MLLFDVLGFSLAETAEALRTTVGAVKSALHRGRAGLRESMASDAAPPPVDRGAIAAFVERYNERDLPGLLALMLDGAVIDMPGHVHEAGRAAFERDGGWFHHNFYNPGDGSPSDAWWELVEFRGQPVVLVLYGDPADRVLGSVMRFRTEEGRVRRIQVYALAPDVVGEVAEELGRVQSPVRFYRFPFRMQDSG